MPELAPKWELRKATASVINTQKLGQNAGLVYYPHCQLKLATGIINPKPVSDLEWSILVADTPQ